MVGVPMAAISGLLAMTICSVTSDPAQERWRRQVNAPDGEPCVCVPYYQCGDDGKIDQFGTFTLIPKIDESSPRPTCLGVDICCGLPDDKDNRSPSLPDFEETDPPSPDTGGYEPGPPEQPSHPDHPDEDSGILVPQNPPDVTGCGAKRLNALDPKIDTDTRITGDDDKPLNTFYGEFPWMITVFKEEKGKKNFICGGSLIEHNVVLTAAHCVAKLDLNEVLVRAGDWDARNSLEPIPHQDRKASRVVIHKDFDSGNLRNDIALVFTDRPFELGPTIDLICIPKPDSFDPQNCQASGWGVNKLGDKGLYQPVLKKVYLPLIERESCQGRLRKTRLGNYFKLHQSFRCAGGVANKDTCTGDGGGPLVCADFEENLYKYAQIGIVSWGIGCGNNTPGVYTDVQYFHDWIQDQISLH